MGIWRAGSRSLDQFEGQWVEGWTAKNGNVGLPEQAYPRPRILYGNIGRNAASIAQKETATHVRQHSGLSV